MSRPRRPKMVVQRHHIVYAVPEKKQPDFVVPIRKEEHFYITKLNRFKYVSKGLITALKFFILMHEDTAIDLEQEAGKR